MIERVKKTKLNDVGALIKGRRTINFYQQKSVPISELTKAIEIARWAPNHKITEPWHFYILGKKTRYNVIQLITDMKSAGKGDSVRESTKKRLDDIPGWFVLTSDLSNDPIEQQENYAACCCAAQNIMLVLWRKNIGVKWTTGDVTRDQQFYTMLKINQEARRIVGLFWYGYPSMVPKQKRKSVKDISTKLE
jgi:nitroreductase